MPEVYIARRKLKVGDRVVLPGEAVPEARTWRNLHSYLATGVVKQVHDPGRTVKVKLNTAR